MAFFSPPAALRGPSRATHLASPIALRATGAGPLIKALVQTVVILYIWYQI